MNDRDKRLALMYAKLQILGVAKITVEFDGSGDSGQVQGIRFENARGDSVNTDEVRFEWQLKANSKFVDGVWTEGKSEVTQVPVADIIDELFYEADSSFGYDWVNNDGGYGEMTVDLTANPPQAHVVYKLRITNVEEHEHDATNAMIPELPAEPAKPKKRAARKKK